ncbi:hypothetical protein PAPYR_5621 [Paratrimastix pyriformis]|uniref:Uncharacterized protein n=1 Tax=Paratrimastix pyriformis TaxID=342808 RepID=A0ABQ8UJR5_9EUKA|nr:hypothetical protein PAPYR_5621 [Paratrimastix pyriformis]
MTQLKSLFLLVALVALQARARDLREKRLRERQEFLAKRAAGLAQIPPERPDVDPFSQPPASPPPPPETHPTPDPARAAQTDL